MRRLPLRRRIGCWIALVASAAAVAAPGAGAAEPTVVELPAATHAEALAPTPDGSVWFSLRHGEKWEGAPGPALGRRSADGTVAEVPLAMPGTTAIPVAGPNGSIWVFGSHRDRTGRNALRIGRVAPSGGIAESYTVGHGKAGILAIAPTHGAVWFALSQVHGQASVRRLSLADGSVREVSLRTHCQAEALVARADGSVWFTERCDPESDGRIAHHGSCIDRITAKGYLTRYRLHEDEEPLSIALGHGGTLWFGTGFGGGGPKVGFINRSGELSQYRVGHGSLYGIAVGPEGRLWFPSSFGGGIHRALNSIGAHGDLGRPVCADPTCELEPSSLVADPRGGLSYALAKPHSIGGGGGTQIAEGIEIEDEAGFIGHLVP